MTILITGSSGHLGEALVRTVRSMNHRVISIDVTPSPWTDIVGSITDREIVRQAMQGVDVVLHAATLHKPHIVTHSKHDFVDANVSGTLCLLEEAVSAGVQSFIFTSTTSTFGDAMRPGPTDPTVWVTEDVVPIPKNIYGLTKIAAEDLCYLFHRNHQLPCLILRTSRFFLEADDDPTMRNHYPDLNIKANEFLYRRVDLADVVDAHLLAIEKAPSIGFGRYIISATPPFETSDLPELNRNLPAVLERIFPDYPAIYAKQAWEMFPKIGRVYVNEKARRELGWRPTHDFRYVLDSIQAGRDFRSALALEVGIKGYHDQSFEEGPYPV